MILAVNIGNTNTSVGVWRDGRIRQESIATRNLLVGADFWRFLENLLEGLKPTGSVEGSVMASVVPGKTRLVADAIESLTGAAPQLVDSGFDTGMDLSAYDNNLLGADRVVCCTSALAKYAPPLAVFDLGTATTVNVVNATGAFLGGAILPGVQMGLEALATGTSLLPMPILGADVPVIGRDTRQCLAAGAVYGAACMIEGFVRRIEDELGQTVTTVVTGGNAPYIIPHCSMRLHLEPTLLLEGLILLYQGYRFTNRKGNRYADNQ